MDGWTMDNGQWTMDNGWNEQETIQYSTCNSGFLNFKVNDLNGLKATYCFCFLPDEEVLPREAGGQGVPLYHNLEYGDTKSGQLRYWLVKKILFYMHAIKTV